MITLLCSCSSGQDDAGKVESKNIINLTLDNPSDTLKDFEVKGSYAYLGGMGNADSSQRVLYILIRNHDNVARPGSMRVDPPKGKAEIEVRIFGKAGKDKHNLAPLTAGAISNVTYSNGEPAFSVQVSKSGWQGEMISGAPYLAFKDMKGSVELTEISDTHAKGTLVYTEKGNSTITLDFDVVIEKDNWK